MFLSKLIFSNLSLSKLHLYPSIMLKEALTIETINYGKFECSSFIRFVIEALKAHEIWLPFCCYWKAKWKRVKGLVFSVAHFWACIDQMSCFLTFQIFRYCLYQKLWEYFHVNDFARYQFKQSMWWQNANLHVNHFNVLEGLSLKVWQVKNLGINIFNLVSSDY